MKNNGKCGLIFTIIQLLLIIGFGIRCFMVKCNAPEEWWKVLFVGMVSGLFGIGVSKMLLQCLQILCPKCGHEEPEHKNPEHLEKGLQVLILVLFVLCFCYCLIDCWRPFTYDKFIWINVGKSSFLVFWGACFYELCKWIGKQVSKRFPRVTNRTK